jgi:predicted peptidase
MRLSVFIFSLLFLIKNAYSQTAVTPAKELNSKTYHYLLYLPDSFNNNTSHKWPLIIYLHGKSACGSNLTKVRRYGLPFFLDRDMKIQAIVVAPQCPAGKNWVSDNWFVSFLDELKSKFPIDENRIYLTGMSLGGFGTFSLAIKYPEIFAAVVPLCGGGQPSTACAMKDIPTWVFHGDKDELVPIARSTEMVNAIKKCGGKPKYSILKGQPHDIHKTYGNAELYEWMLAQTKGEKIKETESAPALAKNTENEKPQPAIKQKSIYKVSKRDSKVKSTMKAKQKGETKEESESEKIKVEFN